MQTLVERHNGQVPDTFEELEQLAGVGHKTASVVMAVAFKKPTFPVDTHIYRSAAILSWFGIAAVGYRYKYKRTDGLDIRT